MQLKKCSPCDIILDARMIRHSGIGTYIRGLLGIYEKHPFFQKYSLSLAAKQSDGVFQTFRFHSSVYSLGEQLEYPFRLRHCKLWHAPHYNVPLVKGKTRLVVTIHDLIHWIFRKEFFSPLQAFYAGQMLTRAVNLADRIIAVSNRTRDDLIRHFKAHPGKIRVISEGAPPEFFNPPDASHRKSVLEKYKLSRAFFLYVGLLKPHKNVQRLVEVFRGLQKEKKIHSDLVLVGKKDRKYPAGFESLQTLRTENGIHYIPAVDSMAELASLYSSALALVHPSLYEGFGLTCLEAMASGTPVIVSNTASLPEVVGDAGRYVDPRSSETIREALVEVEQNGSLRSQMIEKGRQRARQFSWDRAARETLEVYREVLDSK